MNQTARRLKQALPIAVVAFALGALVGHQATQVAPVAAASDRAALAVVRPGSVIPEDAVGEAAQAAHAPSRTQRRKALATLMGEDRTGIRRALVGHNTLSQQRSDGRGWVVADVYWDMERLDDDVAYTQAIRRPWFSDLATVVFDTALEAVERTPGARWPSGYMVPVRVRDYGILLARFSWHTHSGQTGERFDRPTPALELFEPVHPEQLKRAVEAYDTLAR